MHFKLSDEHEMIRKMVRDFAKNEVEPSAAQRDEEQQSRIVAMSFCEPRSCIGRLSS